MVMSQSTPSNAFARPQVCNITGFWQWLYMSNIRSTYKNFFHSHCQHKTLCFRSKLVPSTGGFTFYYIAEVPVCKIKQGSLHWESYSKSKLFIH